MLVKNFPCAVLAPKGIWFHDVPTKKGLQITAEEISAFCKISANHKSAGSSSAVGNLLTGTCGGNSSTASLDRHDFGQSWEADLSVVRTKWCRFN